MRMSLVARYKADAELSLPRLAYRPDIRPGHSVRQPVRPVHLDEAHQVVASGELVCAAAQRARGKTIRLGRLPGEEDLNGPLAPGQAGSGRGWNGTSRAGTSSGWRERNAAPRRGEQ